MPPVVLEQGVSGAAGATGSGLVFVTDFVEDRCWSIAVTESEGGGARVEIGQISRSILVPGCRPLLRWAPLPRLANPFAPAAAGSRMDPRTEEHAEVLVDYGEVVQRDGTFVFEDDV
jgi:hypothetical protein